MPRRARATPGGLVYHVLNQSVAGLPLFRKEADFGAFERIMVEAHGLHPLRILAWYAMRTRWHFVVWPREEGEVTACFRLAHTHAMRWHVAHNTIGRSKQGDERRGSGGGSEMHGAEPALWCGAVADGCGQRRTPMAKKKKQAKTWMLPSPSRRTAKAPLAERIKADVDAKATKLVEKLKPKYVQPPPKNPRFNYIIDVWTKWLGGTLYFGLTYACPNSGDTIRVIDEGDAI